MAPECLYHVMEIFEKSVGIYGARKIFHSPWVSGFSSFALYFSLFPDNGVFISETKSQMKETGNDFQ